MVNCDTCQKLMKLQMALKQKDAYISNILLELNQYKRMAMQKKSDLSDIQMQSSIIIKNLHLENNELKTLLNQYKIRSNSHNEANRKSMGTPKLPNWNLSSLRKDDIY